jgi:hypothetical protein
VPIANKVYVALASHSQSQLTYSYFTTVSTPPFAPPSLPTLPTMTDPAPTKPPLPVFDPQNCQTYPASCHCGIVQYSVLLSPPLAESKVVSCNCSICTRNGYLLVYPERSQLQVKSGEEMLRDYSFGRKRNLHRFCGSCGSAIWFDPRMAEFGDAPPDLLGVNVCDDYGDDVIAPGANLCRSGCCMVLKSRSWMLCMLKIRIREAWVVGKFMMHVAHSLVLRRCIFGSRTLHERFSLATNP